MKDTIVIREGVKEKEEPQEEKTGAPLKTTRFFLHWLSFHLRQEGAPFR